MNSAPRTLILGGVRSGKSRLAERLAGASGLEVVYIATATDQGDEQMQARIAAHRDRRPASWSTVEAPLQLARALAAHAAAQRCLLVDCLTLWLSNLLCDGRPGLLETERAALLRAVDALPGRLILVGNETGMGVVPMGELSRRFVDEAGTLHQQLAERCERVVLTVAGLAHDLKKERSP